MTAMHSIDALSAKNQSKVTYLPIYIETGGKEELAKKDKSLWHLLGGENSKILIEKKSDKIVLCPSKNGISLHTPENISENVDSKSGDLALGVFPICENENGKLLFVKKTKGEFWYIPGGLVETHDKTLWTAGVRELKEETGLYLNEQVEGRMLYAYESVTATRHNLMTFYSAKYEGCDMLPTVISNDEIEACMWFDPFIFWCAYLKGSCKSLPSIRYVFQYYLKDKFCSIDPNLQSEYEKYKKNEIGSLDSILFDVCFLKIKTKNPKSLNESLVKETKNFANFLMSQRVDAL